MSNDCKYLLMSWILLYIVPEVIITDGMFKFSTISHATVCNLLCISITNNVNTISSVNRISGDAVSETYADGISIQNC